MKNLTITLALILCFILNSLAQKPIAFSKEKDDYVILVAENRTPAEATAAAELKSFMEKLFEREYEIVTDATFKGPHAISVGRNKLSEKLYRKYAPPSLTTTKLSLSSMDSVFSKASVLVAKPFASLP